LRQPAEREVIGRFNLQVQADMAAGRIAIVDGWLVADTELILLASIRRSPGKQMLLGGKPRAG
jgi:hypothetical protein